MRFLLVLLLISAVTCVFFHQDVFTDGSLSDTGHKTLKALEADYKNSESEQKRLQGRVDTYEEERNRYINLANDLIGADNSSVSSMHSIAVSALSSSYKDKIASRLGLTAQAVLNLFGSSSLESTIESFISTARNYEDSAWSAYNNTNRTEGYDSANSAIEAWYENGRAADHHNAHVSPGEYLIGTPPPDEPSDIKWPSFSCPDGSCGLSWLLPSSARTAHYARCGTKDDPYNTSLQGCNKVYYTCNTSEKSRHQPVDCGLNKWLETTHGWAETACLADYRKCMPGRIQREHSTLLTGVNVTSTCGGSRPSPPSENPIVSPPPPPTPPPSPTYHACGEHETSVSGDHSLQASCSSTDSNGNYCTVTNFYACDSHTHAYPAPPSPPPPSLVECPHPNCSDMVSSRTSHRSECSEGHYYWPGCSSNTNSWSQDSTHTSTTCSRCGVSFRPCSNSNTCHNGAKHTP